MRRTKPSVVRTYQKTLDGVKLTVIQTMNLGTDGRYMPGADVTEIGKHWVNLPSLIKCGYITADPPVDYTSLEIKPDPAALKKLTEANASAAPPVVPAQELR